MNIISNFMKIHKNRLALAIVGILLVLNFGCRKTEYNTIADPAYIRVFNSLNYEVDILNKEQPIPFLTMIIDPEYDANGAVKGGKTIGDFLDQRAPYAPPYPAFAGSTSYKNPEYPGNQKVLVGPVKNGFDLSSWAQMTSGTHRIVFYTRPISPTPFFSLQPRDRQNKIIDTTITWESGAVYTLEVLQGVLTQQFPMDIKLYQRKESFTDKAFDENKLYVNFYNLSAQGYAAANPGEHPDGVQHYYSVSNQGVAFGDTLNMYASLFATDAPYPFADGATPDITLIPGYNNAFLGTLIRSHSSGVAPYFGFPLFAGPDTTKGILSTQWELFSFLRPDLAPMPGPVSINSDYGMGSATAQFGAIGCSNISADGLGSYRTAPRFDYTKYLASAWLPNLIKYSPSGIYKQRAFATVSTIEIINNQVYLMSLQRTYAPPAQ